MTSSMKTERSNTGRSKAFCHIVFTV